MLFEKKQMDKEYQKPMARFARSMENLGHSVSNVFGMMGALLQTPQPSYWQPQLSQQYMAQQGDRVLPCGSNDFGDDDYKYASL